MTSTHLRAGAIACALLASTALAKPALAQVTSPTFRQTDGNGVDLVQGDLVTSFTEGTIGSGEGVLPLLRMLGVSGGNGAQETSQWDHIMLYRSSIDVEVDFGTRHDSFPGAESRGATLSGSAGSYTYTAPDGTVVAFGGDPGGGDATNMCRDGSQVNCWLIPTSITSPNGKVVTLDYEFWQRCRAQTPEGQLPSPDDPIFCDYWPRLLRASNSYGYAIEFAYASGLGGGPNNPGPPATFHQRTTAKFFNTVVSPTTPQATISYAYPSAGVTDIIDMGGRVWRVTSNSTTVAIRRPGAASNTTSYTLSSGKVTSVTNEGVTTSYSRSVVGSTITMTVTDALSHQTVVTSNSSVGRPSSVTDPLSRTTSFQYDASNRLTRTTMPEGNYVQLTYDGRGNVTQSKAVAKSGSGLADIITSAAFDATCANAKKCNKPNTTTDARGNVTDYTYDTTHGGVLTVTAPAPSGGAVRPQSRYSYTLTNGEYLLTGVSACQTAASCTGAADETKTTTAYDSNGNATSVTRRNGTGTLIATSTITYDAVGNLLTVNGPLSGTADTVRNRYNAARELIGTVSADPDGASSLKHRATRNTYANGLLTKIEAGNVNSQSDADWAVFDPAEVVDITYDTNARVKTRKLSSDTGTAYALTQTSYDGLGRPECVTTRMNTAIYGSLPASACSLGTAGSFGPDRIAKTLYDNAGQVTQQQTAVGTTDAATEATATYTNNGMLATLKDAENNLTTYEYDGFDRLSKTRFPVTTKGANSSSTTDYEQVSYDASSNVTNRRLRDAQNIAFTYDNLNRPTLKNLPGSEPDVTYAYDNLGRLTSANQTGNNLSFTYDALSRNLTQVGPQGTVSSQWDLAGRRTRLTYPGTGLYVDYDYLVTGDLIKIRENGATSGIGVLATYNYDNLGRRTSLTFGNGASQAYGYDAVSRLASLTNNLSGTANDLSQALTYNPAGQIVSNVRTGDAYAWTAHYNENRGYTANGLNQFTASGAITPTYDSKGNLSSAGTATYGYSSENMLVSASGGVSATLSYDPGLRLYQVISGANTTRFAYDGLDLIAEYDGSNGLLRRHVFGPGTDDPIVWYEGSGTTDRRFLGSDERGSIVSISDSSGNMLALNSYDEYGIPGIANAGRFQFTGQVWLPELGVYYYKARIYSPTLGRFLQTDPIGYGAGMNAYAYTHNNPINRNDPFGLDDDPDEPGPAKKPNVVCTGTRITSGCGAGGIADGASGFSTAGVGGQYATGESILTGMGFNLGGMSDAQIRDFGLGVLGTLEYAVATGNTSGTLQTWYGPSGYGGITYQAQINGQDIGNGIERASNWFDLARRIGAWGEAQIRESFIESGIPVYGSQVYISTPLGLRIMDFIVGYPTWPNLMGVEVKTNGGYYSYDQRMKDWSLNKYGGEITGGLLTFPMEVGQTIQIPTIVVRVWTPK